MDTNELRDALGDTGLAGIGLCCFGLAAVASENRRAALGAAATVVGIGLIGHGLVGSFLESMGMGYDDL